MREGEEKQDPRQVDFLGFMLTECSFAYLGWLKAKNNSKVLWSD